MIDNPNTVIEEIFANFAVGGVEIPVAFLFYNGNRTTYVTYQQTDASNELSGDDELENYVDFYDFDVYSKGNYIPIVEALKIKLKDAGFKWHPARSSGDMYEPDTKLYHKSLSFSIERSTQNG
jgi:uncharacterized protein (DUF302 family)